MIFIPDKLNEYDLYSYKIHKYDLNKMIILAN